MGSRTVGPALHRNRHQNPIEHEGTYPLPEAQLDRFMMRLAIGYPERAKELEMLETHADHSTFDDLTPVVHADDIIQMVDIARQVYVADVVKEYLIDLAEASRNNAELLLGASPRGDALPATGGTIDGGHRLDVTMWRRTTSKRSWSRSSTTASSCGRKPRCVESRSTRCWTA